MSELNYINYDFINGDKKIGYADGKIEGNTFTFDYIYIFSENRKLGYGSTALKLIEEDLKSLNIQKVSGVFIAQDGITQKELYDFYEKNGYNIIDGVIVKQLDYVNTTFE